MYSILYSRILSMKFLHICLILLINYVPSLALNILYAHDVASPSHEIWNYELAAALVGKGHNVTMFSPLPKQGQGQKNYHTIQIEGLLDEIQENFDLDDVVENNDFENLLLYHDWGTFSCEHTVQSKGLSKLLSYPRDSFDLILVEYTFTPCLFYLIQAFNYPPTVVITPFLLPAFLAETFGSDVQPAYIASHVLNHNGKFTFFDRLRNFALLKMDTLLRYFYVNDKIKEYATKAFGKDLAPLDSLMNHVSLVLCNTIPGFHHAQPLAPNIIPVGGLHVTLGKELPEEFMNIMNNAKDGVILMSFGTNIHSANIKDDKKNSIIEALGQLKQTVLWKFDADLDNLPKNVILRKWLPQKEILAHPNLKLFISHGGALSTIEASALGVPVLGIPFLLDQNANIQLMVEKKVALKVDYTTMTSAVLVDKINEILNNPVYAESAKKISNVINDQPQKPLERAVFWVEYVARHNGTHAFDPASKYLPFYITSCLDIYLFVFIIFLIVFYVLKKIFNFVKSAVLTKRQSNKLKKK
ncbi:UDP-glycosyltransferase UGT5-like isoform X1 [Diabrotica virgifera virgifera]|uniref:UDP-glucuronosyltransferase n=1 Tax=Diabrotica virgifera virgifera TaxID=50390 RepID=A0ABM5JI79_DIAVI|nr:UDP-glycosyltransferase UGT5-like isoform X1 [Diabrotica virgifera virgifera]